MQSPNWLDPKEQRAWRSFLETYAHLTAVLGRELAEESGMSIQDYAVLVALSERPDGTMRAFELGRELAWEKSRLSHHITRMAQRGLVERSGCPTDKRGAFVRITESGRKSISSAAPSHVSSVRRYFIDQLTPRELEVLTTIAGKVQDALSATGECDLAESATKGT